MNLRNFAIIAHIDHGKSTLADRFLELTKTVSEREMKPQLLDQMELERERGITIKLAPVRMEYDPEKMEIENGNQKQISDFENSKYILNLIDTPGHVDFSYEVSRSLAAVEGAILVVDATQGVQAQTLANVWLALDYGLTIIPVVNKIDLPAAEPQKVAKEIEDALGIPFQEVLYASAKTGQGVPEILQAVIERVPPPKSEPAAPLRALIFDSKYDEYRGVVAYVRIVEGKIAANQKITLMEQKVVADCLEVGYFKPEYEKSAELTSGEIGYIVTDLKEVSQCRVGDTITLTENPAKEPLPGYKKVTPFVYASVYPVEGDQHLKLREALLKLKLNDASLFFEPETSPALGSGFRCGFLGLLHMDIVQERLEREYKLNLIFTSPSVRYQIKERTGKVREIENPGLLPAPSLIEEILEPWAKVEVITPAEYVGALIEIIVNRRGVYKSVQYLGVTGVSGVSRPDIDTRIDIRSRYGDVAGYGKRAIILAEMPLSQVIVDFYDELKSVTRGFASVNYEFLEYRASDLVRLDILVAGNLVDSLSQIVHRSEAQAVGRSLVKKLKELIPRQLFEVSLQAAIGSKIIARENIPPLRKDVIAKLYGGDVTRKRKLLEKQKAGKKRMKMVGSVEIPQEAFLALLKR